MGAAQPLKIRRDARCKFVEGVLGKFCSGPAMVTGIFGRRTFTTMDSGGMNPEIREILAMVDKAQLDVERCVVRAPTDGYPPPLTLRPGQMAVPLPLAPVMAYATDEKFLVATFRQHVTSMIKPGEKAEFTFRSRPERVFSARSVT